MTHFCAQGDVGYNATRRATMFNRRTPDRYPEIIAKASSVADVQQAVQLASERDLHIGVRSGGHNWSGSHLRDGSLVVDVSGIDDYEIDEASLTATAGPGLGGSTLAVALEREGLFFPAGHCKGVALGGYLLQGGYGWNSRALGLACMNVIGIDVVLAGGELVHADEQTNSDLLWAARGSGAGFFGVITKYYLRLHRAPKVFGNALYFFPFDVLEQLYGWAYDIRREVPDSVELMLLMSNPLPIVDLPGIVLTAPVFADSEDQARQALSFLQSCPVLDQAYGGEPFVLSGLESAYEGVMLNYPDEHRWGTDNMWTPGPKEALVAAMREIADSLPPHPAHCLWLNWAPPSSRPDMAYSIEDDIYIALYGAWPDADGESLTATWAEDHMRRLEHLATGIQLADENLGSRPARFMSSDALARFDQVRDRHDPYGRFHGWLNRPPSSTE